MSDDFWRLIDKAKRKNIKDEIVILLIGETGDGKSSLINAMFRTFGGIKEKIAIESNGQHSETQSVTAYTFTYNGKTYVIVDCPGIDDTNGNDAQNFTKIADYAKDQLDHVNLILVLKDSNKCRFTDQVKSVFTRYIKQFGVEVSDRICVFFSKVRKVLTSQEIANYVDSIQQHISSETGNPTDIKYWSGECNDGAFEDYQREYMVEARKKIFEEILNTASDVEPFKHNYDTKYFSTNIYNYQLQQYDKNSFHQKELKRVRDSNEQQIQEKKQLNKKLQSQLIQHQKDLQEIEKQLKETKQQIKKAESDLEELAQQEKILKQAQQDLDQLKAEYQSVSNNSNDSKLNDIMKRLDALKNEESTLQKKIQELQKRQNDSSDSEDNTTHNIKDDKSRLEIAKERHLYHIKEELQKIKSSTEDTHVKNLLKVLLQAWNDTQINKDAQKLLRYGNVLSWINEHLNDSQEEKKRFDELFLDEDTQQESSTSDSDEETINKAVTPQDVLQWVKDDSAPLKYQKIIDFVLDVSQKTNFVTLCPQLNIQFNYKQENQLNNCIEKIFTDKASILPAFFTYYSTDEEDKETIIRVHKDGEKVQFVQLSNNDSEVLSTEDADVLIYFWYKNKDANSNMKYLLRQIQGENFQPRSLILIVEYGKGVDAIKEITLGKNAVQSLTSLTISGVQIKNIDQCTNLRHLAAKNAKLTGLNTDKLETAYLYNCSYDGSSSLANNILKNKQITNLICQGGRNIAGNVVLSDSNTVGTVRCIELGPEFEIQVKLSETTEVPEAFFNGKEVFIKSPFDQGEQRDFYKYCDLVKTEHYQKSRLKNLKEKKGELQRKVEECRNVIEKYEKLLDNEPKSNTKLMKRLVDALLRAQQLLQEGANLNEALAELIRIIEEQK